VPTLRAPPGGPPRAPPRRERRRAGRESDRPIVPLKRVMTAEGRGLTFGVLAWETTVSGDWR
jgi:hypothetical protein